MIVLAQFKTEDRYCFELWPKQCLSLVLHHPRAYHYISTITETNTEILFHKFFQKNYDILTYQSLVSEQIIIQQDQQ